jgi:ATP-dependent DNA helicase RecG
LHELKEIAAGGETERVEFKRSTGQRTEATKSVCAMLNGTGGYLLFGVTDDGSLTGQQVSSRTLEDITRELRRIELPCLPDIEIIQFENGASVVALLIHGGGGPYTYDGRPYLRRGPTTGIMPREQYERLLLERMHATRRWENLPAEGRGLDDLDATEVLRMIEESIRRQCLSDPGTRDLHDLLRGLGLYREGRLLNASASFASVEPDNSPGFLPKGNHRIVGSGNHHYDGTDP